MQLVLALTALLVAYLALRTYGPFSIPMVGVAGFFVYSVPAIIGLMLPFDQVGLKELIPVSQGAVYVIWLGWMSFGFFMVLPRPRRSLVFRPQSDLVGHRNLENFVFAAAVLSTGIFLVVAYVQGPLFFLQDRQTSDIVLEAPKLIWRWTNALGLLAAMRIRAFRLMAFFGLAIAAYYLAGDRTVIVITLVAVTVEVLRGSTIGDVVRQPKAIMLGLAILAIAVLGKPIYLAVKEGSLAPLAFSLASGNSGMLAANFEPFVTHYLLELTITYGYVAEWTDVVVGIVGQILIVPSLFGIDSSAYNVRFTDTFASDINFGIAFNYLGQAYSVGGEAGVMLFSALFAWMLRICGRLYQSRHTGLSIASLLCGALIGVYIHRNSLENLASFIRQVGVTFIGLLLLGQLLGALNWVPRGRLGRRASHA